MTAQIATTTFDIAVGSAVACRDGDGGHVSRLVVEPGTTRVTHLVVHRGPLHHDVVAPLARLTRVDDATVVLDMDRAELATLPPFAERTYALPDRAWTARQGYGSMTTFAGLRGLMTRSGWPAGPPLRHHTHAGLSGGAIPIGRGTHVVARGKLVGHVDHVVLDPRSDALQALVVRQGHVHGKDVLIPASWISSVDEEAIALNVAPTQLARLPEYQPRRLADERASDESPNRTLTNAGPRR